MKPLTANLIVLAITSALYAAAAYGQTAPMHPKRYEIPALSGQEIRDALDAIAAAKPGSARRQEMADRLCLRILGPGVVAFFTDGDSLVCRPAPPKRKETTA